MKYLIASVLLAATTSLSAQTNSAQNLVIVKSKVTTVTLPNSVTTAAEFKSSMGGRGTMTKKNDITYITYCQNSGDSIAIRTGNHMDTTNYRAGVSKKDNVITITHPNAQQSTITEDGDLIMIKAAGGNVAVFHKASSPSQNDGTVGGNQYLISYNKNTTDVKAVNGSGFKFERKGNVAIIKTGEDDYSVMITTGKSSIVINSRGVYSLVINDDNRISVMPSKGFQSFVYNEGATSRVIWANGESQTVNNYGGLSLITPKDSGADAMFNYGKVETNNDADGGKFTKITIDNKK
ncbi:hypothetical protein [Mucilaginibacter sp. dw_454]|uniref:hypothetical protein n=1 Tax=Mucilaginibacter sp. dw_454 TaxID=2720079 RepID=UPI001BD40391|nr:hypothetical protein [Mucilaginibacter sp. dw_454]